MLQLLVEHTDRPAPQYRPRLRLVAFGPLNALFDQALVAPEFAVIGRNQLETAPGTTNFFEGIAGVVKLKGILERVASATIHRRIDLQIAPRVNQQIGLIVVDGG